MRSYDIFIKEINDIRRWLFTTIYAYNKAYEILSKKIQNGDTVANQVAIAFNEHGCNEMSLARRLSTDNIKTCKELALIRSISALEIFTVDSVKEVFNANRSPFLSNGKIELAVGEFLSCDNMSELHNKYIEQKCRNLHSGGFEEIQKYYKNTFDIEFSHFNVKIDETVYGISFLKQYHQKRHLIVHRMGKTDEQYRKQYNTNDMTIKLDENELSTFLEVLRAFAFFLERRMSQYIMTPPIDNVVEIVVEIMDESTLEQLEPTFAIRIKKNKFIPLSSIIKSKENVYGDIYKITLSGPYDYIRKYYKILNKTGSAGKLKVKSITNLSLAPVHTKIKQYSWNDVEKVMELLPEKPWEKYIHKKIAEQLGWSNNKVSGIINYIENEKPVSLSLGRRRIMLHIGETYTFSPKVDPIELIDSIVFQSGNSNVVIVENETITAIGEGATIVTAMVLGYSYKEFCNVTVVKNTEEIL